MPHFIARQLRVIGHQFKGIAASSPIHPKLEFSDSIGKLCHFCQNEKYPAFPHAFLRQDGVDIFVCPTDWVTTEDGVKFKIFKDVEFRYLFEEAK